MSKLDWSNVDFETMIIHAGQGQRSRPRRAGHADLSDLNFLL